MMMSDTANSLTQWALGVLLGAIGGSGGTFVALRTRLAKTDRDIVDVAAALNRHMTDEQVMLDRVEGEMIARIERLDKRQMAMLRLTTDIARKVGVDGRQFDDALVRMLTDDIT